MNLNLAKTYKVIRNPLFILFIIFIAGVFLRLFNIWDNFTFGYDQGRDAQRMLDIVNFKNFKLVGQESDIPGIFHGVLSYYVLAVVYFIGNFNANYPAIFLSIINALGVFLIYYFSLLLFNNKRIGLVSALLWAVSYEQFNFSRFISNASAMSIVSIIFFLGLAIYIFKNKNWGLTLSVIGLALSVQLNFYLIFLSVFYLIFYLIYKPNIKKKFVFLNCLLLIVLFSSYILAELRWNFMMSKSLIAYLSSHQGNLNLIGSLTRYITKTSEAFYFSFLTINKSFFILIFLTLILFAWVKIKDSKRKYFFFIWLFSTLPLFLFSSGVLETQLINTTLFPPLTILLAYFLVEFFLKRKFIYLFVLLLIITGSNLLLFYNDNFKAIKLLSIQDFTLKDEKNLIDYTYKSAAGKEFSICALTNPLYVNVLWSYLYATYGKDKYGYVPYWSGQEQITGMNDLPYDKKHTPLRYLIIEPASGIPDYAKPVFVYMEDNTSSLVDEKKFSDLVVQKRTLNTDLSIFNDTQRLSNKEILSIKSIVASNPRFSCYTTYSSDK